jgi:hypothetical protein
VPQIRDRRDKPGDDGSRHDSKQTGTAVGRSQDVLSVLVQNLSQPALIWLDAHWCGGDIPVAGKDEECPLLEEIAAIDSGTTQHLILIDDARYFLNRPPPPHNPERWPSAGSVMEQLRAKYDSYISILDDVIIRLPITLQASFEAVIKKTSRPEAIRRLIVKALQKVH